MPTTHTSGHSRDELRRALRESDAAQQEAMPRFREALKRLFSADAAEGGALDRREKAAFLGVPVPARRAFLRSGGLVVVGAIALGACSDDDGDPAETGEDPATTGGGATDGPTAGDVDLATAAIQIENTAVAAYNAVADARGDELRAAGAADLALLFRDHHLEHAGALNGFLTDNDATAIPEDQLFAGITLPTADDIASLPIAEIAGFARGLENQAAQTYITAVPRLTLGVLRQSIMAIGAVEARHVAAYDILLGGGPGGYATTAGQILGGSYPTDESFLNS